MMWYNLFPMKKSAILIVAFLLFAPQAFAESTARVKVNNNVSGSSTSTVKSETNIRVETNGEVTTYSSDKPENIEVNSVNGQTVSSPAKPTSEPSATPTATSVPHQDEENDSDQKNIFNILGEIFKKIFSVFD